MCLPPRQSLIGRFSARSWLCCWILLLPCAANAAPRPFTGPFQPVDSRHFRLQPDSGEFYVEEYELLAWSESGTRVVVNLVINNLGLGDNKARVKIKLERPGLPTLTEQRQYSEGEWQGPSKLALLRLGGTTLSRRPGELQLRSVGKGLKLNLVFQNSLPAWRPGNGRILYDAEGERFYDLTLMAPRARVQGILEVGGERISFAGIGYADHRVSNAPPHKLGRRWLRFQAFDGDWTVLSQGIDLSEDGSGPHARYLLVGYKDRVVFQSLAYELKIEQAAKDSVAETPYSYPKEFRLRATTKGRALALSVRGKRAVRSDLLAGLGAIERAVVSRFARPVGYYFGAEFSLQVELGLGTPAARRWRHQGQGSVSFKQVTP